MGTNDVYHNTYDWFIYIILSQCIWHCIELQCWNLCFLCQLLHCSAALTWSDITSTDLKIGQYLFAYTLLVTFALISSKRYIFSCKMQHGLWEKLDLFFWYQNLRKFENKLKQMDRAPFNMFKVNKTTCKTAKSFVTKIYCQKKIFTFLQNNAITHQNNNKQLILAIKYHWHKHDLHVLIWNSEAMS